MPWPQTRKARAPRRARPAAARGRPAIRRRCVLRESFFRERRYRSGPMPSLLLFALLAAVVVRHSNDGLGLRLSTGRVELVAEPNARIEVFGTVRQEAQVRHVLVAAMSGEGRHAVITFSAPANRWEALLPSIRASLDSF